MSRERNVTEEVSVGDIFYNSWGYDQTNVDWYQVTRKTSKTVFMKRIRKNYKEDGFMSGNCVPVKDSFVPDAQEFGKRPTRYIRQDGTESEDIWVAFSYGAGCKWDGKPKYESHYA